jgi:lysophospholipase L1-like esterase
MKTHTKKGRQHFPILGRRALVAATIAALVHGVMGASAAPPAPSSTANSVRPSGKLPAAPARLPVRPTDDLVVTGVGDDRGFHIYAADARRSALGWQELATLRPDVGNEGGWVGNYCQTGDGRFVVATVAPWFAASRPGLLAHGGFAYSVDVAGGRIRPLASGLTLSYASPGCGPGHLVALTSYGGDDDAPTTVRVADAATGAFGAVLHDSGELTSAVPLDTGTVAAARGAEVVRLSPAGTTTMATLAGQVYDLRVRGTTNDLALLSVTPGRATTEVYNLAGAQPQHLGSGPLVGTDLYAGRNGAILAVGTRADSAAGSGVRWLTPPVGSHVDGAALDLDALLVNEVSSQSLALATTGARTTPLPALPTGATPPVGTAVAPFLGVAGTTSGTATAAASQPANTTTPTCAVARNDDHRQVLQPATSQIDWAAQMATRGMLNTARSGDPSWALRPYTPNGDFPVSITVPREVLEGVMAQESNWDQASWHAARGVAGNPLVANYYGVSSDGNTRDYSNADCGYGLTQQTDGMHVGDSNFTANSQQAIGLDYAMNVAAGNFTLQNKWLQLNALGITPNNNDTSKLENWYFALWAYNSGIHPDDGTGAYGLGWVNNPYNPTYPPNREDFRSSNYADAANPQWWPYQEKVMGWMETPLGKYAPSDAGYYPQATHALEKPNKSQFCTTFDYCQLNSTSPCLRPDSHCWWHWPASWGDGCSSLCTPAQWTVAAGTPEPPPQSNPFPPQCDLNGAPFSNALIVDDEADGNGYDAHVSVNGCTGTPAYVNAGTFSTTMGSMAVVDYHQLGVGFDGRITFTHEVDTSSPQWAITGTWTPNLSGAGGYRIWVFVPNDGATAHDATYVVNDGNGGSWSATPVDQNSYNNQWVPLGTYPLHPGASLALSNVTAASSRDLAFDAVAFEPVPDMAGLVSKYVAMGDSYSSGQGDEPFTVDSARGGCNRSQSGYPTQFATSYTSGGSHIYQGSTAFVACSGATTTNLLTTGYGGEAAQVGWLSNGTRLVTLTIGGNDVGFGPILRSCFFGNGCGDTAFPGLDATIQSMVGRLRTVYTRLTFVAPLAKIVVLTYPQILPPSYSFPRSVHRRPPVGSVPATMPGSHLSGQSSMA